MANAVLDGCDAILLGAETLRGKQPVATVETILHICKQAERCFDHRHHFEHLMSVSHRLGAGVCTCPTRAFQCIGSDTNVASSSMYCFTAWLDQIV